MKVWRIQLAISLQFLSCFILFVDGFYIKTPMFQVAIFMLALVMNLLALALAQDDGAARKKPDLEGEEKIQSDARLRCLDEFVSLIRDEKIKDGIGLDVKRAYYLAVQAANRKRESGR